MLTDPIKAKLTKVCLELGNNYNNLGESIGKLVKVDSKISNIFKKNFIKMKKYVFSETKYRNIRKYLIE